MLTMTQISYGTCTYRCALCTCMCLHVSMYAHESTPWLTPKFFCSLIRSLCSAKLHTHTHTHIHTHTYIHLTHTHAHTLSVIDRITTVKSLHAFSRNAWLSGPSSTSNVPVTHCCSCTATHCNEFQRTVTHCNHCNTLQHTATHCNTPLSRLLSKSNILVTELIVYVYVYVYIYVYVCVMGWLRLVGSLKLYVSIAEYSLFYRALLQKRLIILRSLLIVASP